jgi:hypothetical protein
VPSRCLHDFQDKRQLQAGAVFFAARLVWIGLLELFDL